MNLRLLVLRTGEPEKLVKFYELFGLSFDHHQHGSGPVHYSTLMDQVVFEIYPLAKEQSEPDKNLRLGFGIDNIDELISKLQNLNTHFFMQPEQTDLGFMAIIADPDGRKVELYRK